MFFCPDVLRRHTGCFATIWLAATKGRKLTKKDIMKVAVSQTCEELIRYITAQVPASQPGQPHPRFSLYLSSQLQYGLILVYHRQCVLMLEEARRIFTNLQKSKRTRNDLDVPDRLFLMEQADGAEEPFFGVMNVPSLPSPLPQMLLHTSPPERITIKEQQPLVVNTAEICGGVELTEPTEEELNLLIAMPDNFLEVMAEQEKRDKNIPAEQERDTRDNNTPVPGSMNSVDQRSANQMSPASSLQNSPANQMSPASSLQNPPADPPQVVVRPKKRPAGGQKRKRIFIDKVTQNSASVMKRHIDSPLTKTRSRSLSEVVSLTSIMKQKTSPALLFSTPCSLMIHSDMLKVWTKCAQITAPKKGTRKRPSSEMMSTDSDESSFQPADPSFAPDLQSHSEGNTPTKRCPRGDVQVAMQPIAEENDEKPDAQRLLRLVSLNHKRSLRVTFATLLPLRANRLRAARTMFKLLELVEAKELVVLQTEAFSPMMITPVQ